MVKELELELELEGISGAYTIVHNVCICTKHAGA